MFNEAMKAALQKLLLNKYGAMKAAPVMPGLAESTMAMDKVRGAMEQPAAPDNGYNADSGMAPAQEQPVAPPMPPAPVTPPVTPPATPMPPVAPPVAPPAPITPPTPPAPAAPAPMPQNPVQSVYGAKYDDNARQQLYDSLASKRQQGAGWEALGNIADTNTAVGGARPTNYGEGIREKLMAQDKGAKAEFEAGRESKLKDATTNIALAKEGRAAQDDKEKSDPNSQSSRLATGFAAQMLGPEKMAKLGWVPGKSSYDDVIKVLPIIEKQVALETAKSTRDITLGTRNDQFNAKEWDKIVKDADPLNTNSRSSLGLAAKANLQADTALKTLNHPVVTKQEAGNIMADMASIYQRGSATQYGMSKQQYETLYGKVQGALQEITGNPRDAVPDAVKNRLRSVLADLKSVNQGVISQQLNLIEQSKGKIINSGYQEEWKKMRQTLEGDSQATSSGTPPYGWRVKR